MADHSALRARLESRRDELLQRVARIERDLRKEHDRDWVEQATQLENDEVLEGLDDMGRAELAALGDALRRIEQGAYGNCARCGGPIDPKRLTAVPTATTCVRCATAG